MHYQQGNINIGGKKKKGIQARCILFSCTNNRIRETLRLARTSRINKSSNLLSRVIKASCSVLLPGLCISLCLPCTGPSPPDTSHQCSTEGKEHPLWPAGNDPALNAARDSVGHLCLNTALLDQGQLVTHQDSQLLLCKVAFHIVSVPSLYWCLELLLPMSRTCHFQFLYVKGFLSRNISAACRGCSEFLKNYLVLKSSTLKSR